MILQHIDRALSLSQFSLGVVRLQWPLRPLPPALQLFSLLLSDGRSFCVWMILKAHHSPVLRAIAFIAVANVPRPGSCAMSWCASMPGDGCRIGAGEEDGV